ncbi:MAG: ParB/RepB/Spo0J family partition protein, partial [Candidatus Onthovivens sp.]|nr:ParB/RepB/Spo0J family partition protein [Candidatus Onthovivens sp.]
NLKNIKSSIEENGVYKPFYVNYKDNKYEVIIGRKRLRASKELKEENVPCIVFSVNEHEELLMLLADIQDHKEVNMYELSLILNELYSKYNYKLKQLAILINQSIYQVSNILNLVKLPYEILLDLGNNLTSYGICKTLIYAKPNKVMEYYKIYKEKNLSVRDLELLIKNDNKKEKMLNILVDEDNLTINLKFENSEDLHRFLKKINK